MNAIAELLRSARFFSFLFSLDQETAGRIKERRCPVCGGQLDAAKYSRVARGLAEAPDKRELYVFSMCCRHCRKRVTPPSLRFSGQKQHAKGVILLAHVLDKGVTKRKITKLRELLGVSERTIRRWLRAWQAKIAGSTWWRELKARDLTVGSPVDALERMLLAAKSCFNSLAVILREIPDL